MFPYDGCSLVFFVVFFVVPAEYNVEAALPYEDEVTPRDERTLPRYAMAVWAKLRCTGFL